jgi:hypothetical protein
LICLPARASGKASTSEALSSIRAAETGVLDQRLCTSEIAGLTWRRHQLHGIAQGMSAWILVFGPPHAIGENTTLGPSVEALENCSATLTWRRGRAAIIRCERSG